MSLNILVTGAAGYISLEQAQGLAALGADVVQLDLHDKETVVDCLMSRKVNVVIHCASSTDPRSVLNLIDELSKQKMRCRKETFFLHKLKDTSPVFETENLLADSFAIRKTDVSFIEHAKVQGVVGFTIVPSCVYGKGSGKWNQLSVVLPAYVKPSIAQGAVYRFKEDTRVSGVHVSDMSALYRQIVQKVSQNEPIPSGDEGYYLALAHNLEWSKVSHQLAEALFTRGLIKNLKVKIWPNEESAAKALAVPTKFVQPLWNAGHFTIVNRANLHRASQCSTSTDDELTSNSIEIFANNLKKNPKTDQSSKYYSIIVHL
ncbi:hypothetical protein K431DRAFT_322086 [Polychaeton citri CBS 116435]|uniref:NAD(P)-binding protein n=1 Tax=Polychaeton citri CBS 116435 TaxID=1314669 RepID=A0A9P4UND5_9PEZI|nr:hypothetical protein K431DRAFT_322086 [Polychaeton citri CBS 116435]